MKPRCWDSLADWIAWNQCNALVSQAPGRAPDHYCADCSPEYQARMIAQTRCAYPDVTFMRIRERRSDPATGKVTLIDTGMLRGRRSQADEDAWQARYIKQQEEASGENEAD